MMMGRATGRPAFSMVAAVLAIGREQGLHGFYRGWLPAAARAVPSYFIQMPIVERLRGAFGVGSL